MDSPSCDTYRLRFLLRSLGESSPKTVIFLIVLSWAGVSPGYRLWMYYFLSIYFLSLIFESCYHLNLPLTITIRLAVSISKIVKLVMTTKRNIIPICNILVLTSFQRVHHVTKLIQVMIGTCCDWLYRGCYCADTLCIASQYMTWKLNKWMCKVI